MSARILIVDDSPASVKVLAAKLTNEYYQILTAGDGIGALEAVGRDAPDLILLDVMMPRLNGFEVCKQLKEDPQTSSIMILMVTALNEIGDIERAVGTGTDDFLSKPVNQVELVKRVENMLKLKDVTDEVERLRQYIEKMEE